MPRAPTELTEEQKGHIERLAPYLTSEQLADYVGVARRTLYDIMERDPDVAARYKKGKALVVAEIAENLVRKALDGNLSAMVFYLKTQAGWRETDPIGINVDGDQGRDIKITFTDAK